MLNSKEVYHVILLCQEEEGKKGTMFSATNLKTNKEVRRWSCRLGVRQHLLGGTAAYSAEEKNFITVWDPNAKTRKKYRQLNIGTLIRLQVCGIVLVSDGKPTPAYLKLASKIMV